MKEKIFHFIGGVVVYMILGWVMLFTVENDISNKWRYVIIWTLFMTLGDMFIITPLRKKFTAKKEAKQ